MGLPCVKVATSMPYSLAFSVGLGVLLIAPEQQLEGRLSVVTGDLDKLIQDAAPLPRPAFKYRPCTPSSTP